jgi:hypothetical protein
MRELQQWLLILIWIFIFLIFGIDHSNEAPIPTRLGTFLYLALIPLAIVLLILEKKKDA